MSDWLCSYRRLAFPEIIVVNFRNNEIGDETGAGRTEMTA